MSVLLSIHDDLLQTFFKQYRPDASFTVVEVNSGLQNKIKPGLEANIDFQFAEGISYPVPNIYHR